MGTGEQRPKRRYDPARRRADAARRRETILLAAKECFEERGWSGTTMRLVGEHAPASLKTVEALFGTKGRLLEAVLDYAIRGDATEVQMPQRPVILEMETAPDAPSMLNLHAAHLRSVNERSARLAMIVEQGAGADDSLGELWRRMNRNRSFGIDWATRTLLSKNGRRPELTERDVAATFWVALDWGTYRTLTEQAGLSPHEFECWLRRYYLDAFVVPPQR
jgi:AcrR family transcriptional regulator